MLINWLANKWADRVMRRDPDVVIGKSYMTRWYVIPRNRWFNIYLHKFSGSDGRLLHDHPWHSLSYTVRGCFAEYYLGRNKRELTRMVLPADWTYRNAKHLHRLEVPAEYCPDLPKPVTFFMTGPIIRMWGFACPQGWRPYRDLKRTQIDGRVETAGCGEIL